MSKRMQDEKVDEICEFLYDEWRDLDIDDKMEFCRAALRNLTDYDSSFDIDAELDDLISAITSDLKTGETDTVGESVELIKEKYDIEGFEDEDEY